MNHRGGARVLQSEYYSASTTALQSHVSSTLYKFYLHHSSLWASHIVGAEGARILHLFYQLFNHDLRHTHIHNSRYLG